MMCVLTMPVKRAETPVLTRAHVWAKVDLYPFRAVRPLICVMAMPVERAETPVLTRAYVWAKPDPYPLRAVRSMVYTPTVSNYPG
jgi:hypothetical protein